MEGTTIAPLDDPDLYYLPTEKVAPTGQGQSRRLLLEPLAPGTANKPKRCTTMR